MISDLGMRVKWLGIYFHNSIENCVKQEKSKHMPGQAEQDMGALRQLPNGCNPEFLQERKRMERF